MWADFSNTGYLHDPGYTGTGGNCTHGYAGLTDYAAGMTVNTDLYVDQPVNHVFSQVHFRGTSWLGKTAGDSWVFNGCVFDNSATGGANNIIRMWLNTVCRWNYCTFKSPAYTLPPGNDGTVTTAHTGNGTPCGSSWQYIGSAGFDAGTGQNGTATAQWHDCDIWGNAGIQLIDQGTAAHHTEIAHCYIHDQADLDNSGGCGYHHDGIGPTPGTVSSPSSTAYLYVTDTVCVSRGTSQGLAMQDTILTYGQITGSMFGGFGYTASFGEEQFPLNHDMMFTGNVFTGEVAPVWGYLYNTNAWNSAGGGAPGTGMLWRGNRVQYRAGDPGVSTADHGKFLLPSGGLSVSDYTG